MKKLIFLITFYLAVGLSPNSVSAQVEKIRDKAAQNEIVALQEQVITLASKPDSTPVLLNGQFTVVPTDSITYYIERLDSTLARINDVGDVFENSGNLINYTLLIKDGFVQVIKEAPKPNTKDGVVYWIELLQQYFAQLIGTLTFLVTALFRVIRKDPTKVKTLMGKAIALTRTRYFAPAAGFVLSMVGFAFFSEGAWGAGAFIIYTVSSIFMAFGIDNILKLLTGFFDRDKTKPKQTETA